MSAARKKSEPPSRPGIFRSSTRTPRITEHGERVVEKNRLTGGLFSRMIVENPFCQSGVAGRWDMHDEQALVEQTGRSCLPAAHRSGMGICLSCGNNHALFFRRDDFKGSGQLR